jgi:serine/threonine-protein kinase
VSKLHLGAAAVTHGRSSRHGGERQLRETACRGGRHPLCFDEVRMLERARELSRTEYGGAVLEGRYRIGKILGKGATSVVYAATSLAPAIADHGHRRVALKILAGDLIGDAEAVARFTHEAFLSSQLRHPNLVPVVDFGLAQPGRPYFVMVRCAGVSLDRVLARAGKLPRALVLHLLTDAAEALSALHMCGIVHRDVKPSNLFCSLRRGRRPRVRLIDLGVAGVFDAKLARRLGAVEPGARGTYGTPAYIAPEQALGRRTDARTDVYALACVAYRLLTGSDPFPGSSMTATVHGHLFHDARPASALNPALSPEVDAVLARGMAKDPSSRTDGVGRLAAELGHALRS